MRYLQDLEVGIVYWLKDFSAPKVYNGLYFECLLTDQKIPAHCKAKSTGIHLLKWSYCIGSSLSAYQLTVTALRWWGNRSRKVEFIINV